MLRELTGLLACGALAACSAQSPAEDTSADSAASASISASTDSEGEESSSSGDDAAEAAPRPTARSERSEESASSQDAAEETEAPKAPSRDFTTDMTATKGYPGISGDFIPVEVRAGHHDGYERVVVEYTGTGTLNWAAGYSEQPIEEGSGFVIDMAGDTFLTLWVSGIAYPEKGEEIDLLPTGLDQLLTVRDVHVDAPFEGMHTVFIGLDKELPYHVQVLHDPERLVVDVKTK